MSHEKQQTPYGGCLNGVPVETAPHLVVSGPTGRGKSLRVLVPGAMFWRGPRVIVSSKTDFLKKCIENGIQHRGPLYIMDLGNEIDASFDWLQGVDYTWVSSDPTTLINGGDEALAMATMLMQVGSLGNGGSGGSSEEGAFWQTLTVRPLAALLLAAQACGGGIDWVVQAAGRVNGDGPDDETPSWVRAVGLTEKISRHSADLASKIGEEEKTKSGIRSTMATALTPWTLDAVIGIGEEQYVPFAPNMLEGDGESEPTLAIVVGSDGPSAGAAVAVAESIIRHWRRGVERGIPRVLLAIDEFANTCPIPKISSYLSEARGLGVACMLALQSTKSQLAEKYGQARADSIREVAPAVLVLQGDAGSKELMENAAWWDGEEDGWTISIDHQGHESRSSQRVPRTSAQSLLPRSVEEGRLLLYGQKGHMVELPGIWAMG